MTMPALNSSFISRVEYDPWSRVMELTFHNGRTYTLRGVPDHHYSGLLRAASPGSYFNTHLRGRY